MSRISVKRPPSAGPFIRVDGRWYVDLFYNFGDSLTVDFADVMRFLADVPPEAVMLGRCLTPGEERQVTRDLADADDDIYARLITSDHARWRKPR